MAFTALHCSFKFTASFLHFVFSFCAFQIKSFSIWYLIECEASWPLRNTTQCQFNSNQDFYTVLLHLSIRPTGEPQYNEVDRNSQYIRCVWNSIISSHVKAYTRNLKVVRYIVNLIMPEFILSRFCCSPLITTSSYGDVILLEYQHCIP